MADAAAATPAQHDIVLCTMNAKWEHASFGLRCLMANLAELSSCAVMIERTIHDRASDIAEEILSYRPKIVGIGVYVWNAVLALEVVTILKRVLPDLHVVIGGPEVSHEVDAQDIVTRADYVVTGEADVAFMQLCTKLLAGKKPLLKRIDAGKPELHALQFPYALYTHDDLHKRILYVEASRGCPFTCEFCLSALDDGVRTFALEAFLAQMQTLLERFVGGRLMLKFVDRTFNMKIDDSAKILEFFLARMRPGLHLHFEMIPDRLPERLRSLLGKFPAGTVQLEVGIQTLDVDVSKRIARKQDVARIADNLAFLKQHTGVHVHADLIVGLPGESLAMFGAGYDQLYRWQPEEIQVGILKRLRGTPLRRHDGIMRYTDTPPYEVLCTDALDFVDVQRLKRFARYHDVVANSGRFKAVSALLFGDAPFAHFLAFSDWLWRTTRATSGIALSRLARLLTEFLVSERGVAAEVVAHAMELDIGRDRMASLVADDAAGAVSTAPRLPKRQARHVMP